MGPRATRRNSISVAEDEDDEEVQTEQLQPQKRSDGKLKSVNKNGSPSMSKSATPKASPRKSKGNVVESPKQNAKPIYSFFNATTQRQQSSQTQRSSQKLPTIHDEVEVIYDGSDDDESPKEPADTTLSKGSSTALAMRKRKFDRTHSFENDAARPPAASQKFRKVGSGDRVSSISIKNEDKRPWTEQFAPVDMLELAVHKKKVADVRNWLELSFRGKRQKILVLKGPAGSGKTVTVQLLAKELGIKVVEWRDQTASDFATEGTSTAARFEEFVIRAGKVAGLTFSTDPTAAPPAARPGAPAKSDGEMTHPQMLLVEEFPNTFSRTSNALQSFRSTLAQYVSTTVTGNSMPTPMIMIVSETLLSTNTAAADSFTAHRLLGPELGTNPYIATIDFNPVAPTFLIKALETIVVKESRKSGRSRTPGPLVLKTLAETGDIRSAISSLEFLCVGGDDGDTWSSKVAFTKSKRAKAQQALTKSEEEALKLISSRESTLGIFHSVGKVVYNKRADPAADNALAQPPAWFPQHQRPKVPETDAEALIDELGTDTPTFVAALHENYVLSCSGSSTGDTLDSLSSCIDLLSDSDLLSIDRFSLGNRAFSGSAMDSVRQDEMQFHVAVRGLLFSLPHPVHRSEAAGGKRGDAFRMFYPASLRIWRKKEEVEGKLDVIISKLASKDGAGAAASRAKMSNLPSGVESWRQYGSFKAGSAASSDQEVDIQPQLSTEAKNEMLMDRLPYLTHILGAPKTSRSSYRLRDQIGDITRLDGTNLQGDDEVDDAEEDPETALNPEQWATDKPEKESASMTTSPRKHRAPPKPPLAFDGVTLPVESRVERLVLEDDDIED